MTERTRNPVITAEVVEERQTNGHDDWCLKSHADGISNLVQLIDVVRKGYGRDDISILVLLVDMGARDMGAVTSPRQQLNT